MNMATPTTPEGWQAAYEACRQYVAQQRRLMIALYGQWVSELEPELLYGRDFLSGPKGLGVAGDPTRTVVIPNPDWRPGFLDMLYKNL